jgi:chromosome partitioning protein
MGKPHIIAVLNQKGGVGKTTTTINVCSYLAKAGKSVLLVDLDPQGNATSGIGIDKTGLTATLYDVLFSRSSHVQATIKTSTKNLKVLPANPQLASAEVELVQLERREFKLKEILSDVDADFVLIDCPPSLGLLSVNALTAADSVLIPVQTEYYALEGLGQLLYTIQLVREGLNPDLELLGVVMTMFDSRTSLSGQVLEEVKKHFGDKIFKTIIPRNVRLAEAPSFGKAIGDHDKWSKGARAYKQLTKEVIERVQR